MTDADPCIAEHPPMKFGFRHLDVFGVCCCDCSRCDANHTMKSLPICICPECNAEKCGLHAHPLAAGSVATPEEAQQ